MRVRPTSSSTDITAMSVTIRLTHRGAVRGKEHSRTILGLPERSVCSMATMIRARSGGEVHRTADVSDAALGQHPVGQVAALRDLHRPQHRYIYVSATNHGEALDGVEEGHARVEREELTARVDEVNVLLTGLGHRAVAKYAALAVVGDTTAFRDELGAECGYAYAQVHDVAVLEFSGDAHSYDFAVESSLFPLVSSGQFLFQWNAVFGEWLYRSSPSPQPSP